MASVPTPIDLTPFAGIPVTLDASACTLQFAGEIAVADTERRTANALAPVLHAPGDARADDIIYTVYRGLAPPETATEIARRGLTFVALVMRPGTVAGDEWVRTRGHHNPSARSTSVTLPEVHEVWSGSGLLYLQKSADAAGGEIVVIPLEAGDKVVVAPGWANLIANVGETPLVLGSWRTQDSIPQHDALAAMGGMAHFLLRDLEAGSTRFAPNPRYASAAPPLPRHIAPEDRAEFGLIRGEPMLLSFHRNPEFLRFMRRPQDYEQVWAGLYRDAEAAS